MNYSYSDLVHRKLTDITPETLFQIFDQHPIHGSKEHNLLAQKQRLIIHEICLQLWHALKLLDKFVSSSQY